MSNGSDKKTATLTTAADTAECLICYTNLTVTNRSIAEVPCHGHEICKACIVRWLAEHTTCPKCRAVVKNPPRAAQPRTRIFLQLYVATRPHAPSRTVLSDRLLIMLDDIP